ncbi:MAG: hypothetical protein M3281_10325, partial [Chloroflexota bacterium]|nr:hypothetical protein [Chloroflexota bacterium]
MTHSRPDVVSVSHLSWNWVWQRPQHLMCHLSEQYRIFWTEEPRIEIGPDRDEFEIRQYNPNLTLSRLVLSSDYATFWRHLNALLDA